MTMMNELRQNPVSGDWVIIAPGRAARPKFLEAKKISRKPSPKSTCPFEDFRGSGNGPVVVAWPSEEKWEVAVIPNKYPALEHGKTCSVPFHRGIYYGKTGIGNHELVITRDHNKSFADLSPGTAMKVFEVIQGRYHAAARDGCSEYVVPFFNWGGSAGASLWHPHYQVLSLPAVPAHTVVSLERSEAYFKKHRRCLRCEMVKTERKEKKRVVDENKHAIAFTPYASKTPFEVMVTPRIHSSYFRDASRELIAGTAALLQSVIKRLRRHANDPDFNFFIHDAPLGPKKYDHHHWHIEVLPRISIPAGFEFSTGIYINTAEPEQAAKILRGGHG